MVDDSGTKALKQLPRISPLARRLVIFTVAFSTLVALMTTAIQLYVDYRRELGAVESTFRQVDHIHLPVIASALWATNKKELQIALDGLSRLPDVRYVSVTEQGNTWAATGKQKTGGVKTRDYQLSYKHRDKLVNIGNLRLQIDLEGIYERLLQKFWVILITNGVKTFLVSGFMLWLFHWLLTRHLRYIAEFASRLGIDNLEEKLQLPRPESSKPDEFDLVLDGFSRMQNNLGSTLEALQLDIRERKQAEEKLKLSASVFKHSHQGIMITNADGGIIDVNPAFSHITGFTREEVLGQNQRILQSNRHSHAEYRRVWQLLRTRGHWRGEVWSRRNDGDVFPGLVDISAVHGDGGDVINYVSVFSDITQQKQHETELDHIAHFDQLTGMPNRRLLIDRLNQALPRTRREKKLLAVAYVDLDEFKPINDKYGHAVGDSLLVEISLRLRDTLRGGDTLARLGGDEFVMLLGELDHVDACLHSIDRALKAVRAPVVVNDIPLEITASIGVTLYPLDEDTGDTLLRHADQAMYTAKQAGKNRYHLFDPEQDREKQDRKAQMQRLAESLHAQEFVLYHQPKVNLLTGEFVGVEGLLRWRHPEQGLLAPSSFLDMFTKHPLEIELGVWVMESALKQIETWGRQGLRVVTSVNISAHHLLHPDFVEQLAGLLAKYPAVPPGQLELELLETAAMSDLSRAIEVMAQCKDLGVHLSLDDFGTGYSSLAYFRHFPVDVLKIDKSFVHDMIIDHKGVALVESIVRLAELFKCSAIAEGVETEEQISALIGLGCHCAQGYYIAHPMPARDIPAWLENWRTQSSLQKLETQGTDMHLLKGAKNFVDNA